MRLVDCFVRPMAYAIRLRRGGADISADYGIVRADFERLIFDCRQTARDAGFSAEDIDSAMFAVCALIDEVVMMSAWEGRNDWIQQPLQRRYFQTANAGQEFYSRLDCLPPDNKDVREVFATCLALGFAGRYYGPDQEAPRNAVKQEAFRSVWAERGKGFDLSQKELFPGAYPGGKASGRGRAMRRLHPLVILAAIIPPVFLAVLFVSYRSWLGGAIDRLFGL